MVIVKEAPHGTAIRRRVDPEGETWQLEHHLMAAIFDVLQGANWQRSGNPSAPRPEPLMRPGVEPPKKKVTTLPLSELRRRLKADRRAA